MSIESLPAVAHELISLLGQADALRLMERWGGTYLNVPSNPANAAVLAQTLSPEGVRKLCAHYAGERINYIPKLDKMHKAARRRAIIDDCLHMTRRAVALKHGVSMEYVRRINRDNEAGSSQQGDLFGR